jgi:hypothetical protein
MTEGFTHWIPLCNLRTADLPRCGRGKCCAVYALRDAKTSEILKFGETQDLRRRIFGNYIGGIGVSALRIHEQIFRRDFIDHVEIAWIEAKSKTKARLMEKKFRRSHKSARGSRPIWDLRG